MDAHRPTTRRHFLTGQAVLQAVDELAGGRMAADSPQATLEIRPRSYLIRYTHRAMASDFQLFLVAGADERGAEAALAAFDLLDNIETRLTVFRETSEVLEINRRAYDEPVAVELDLFALLQRADALYRDTGGAYDITSGPLSKAWGFARRQGTIPDEETLAAARACVGGEHVLLDAAAQTVRFTRPGVELNFNSIGKGYALDACSELMRRHDVENFIWHGGQSSVLAHGTERAAPVPDNESPNSPSPVVHSTAGWTIGVGHPLRPDRRLAEIVVRNRAVGTSGAGFQFFRHAGKRYGHILDPRTGGPAEGVFSVTVLAPTAAEADALSTAFYVLGFDESVRYCERRPGAAFLMLLPAEGGSAVELATCGLDDHEYRVL